MSIYRPANTGKYHCRFMVKGQWFRRSTGETDRKKALEREAQFRKEFISNSGLLKSTTVGKALEDLKTHKENTPNYKNVVRHAQILREALGPATYLHEVTTAQINLFVSKCQKEYTNSTIKHRLQTLRSAISLAHDNGYLTPSDLKYPKLKTTRGRTRVLSDDEMQAISNELHPDKDFGNWHVGAEARKFRQDAWDLWMIFCDTGARFTEISKLEWSQVDLDGRTILLYRSKVDNETRLVMTDRVYEIFKRRSKNPDSRKFVFTNRKGEARGYTGSAIRKAIKRAGLGSDVTPHVVRHTVATRLLEAGQNIQEVQYIMGHASSQTTERYLHASTQDAARKAAKALSGKKNRPILKSVK